MADDEVSRNLNGMDELDFTGFNTGDWNGVFARYHTDDVLVEVHGQPPTRGIEQHIDAVRGFVENVGDSIRIKTHPIRFGSGEWTCVIGELQSGDKMVTVARWRDGAIAEEYIWV
jgi:hypothetical protein